ncbi:MAG: hypothetical protein IH987_03860, partial [Planctomycetes bacterium]|nr:hypothetical protein [Planctomycetota bacterium]
MKQVQDVKTSPRAMRGLIIGAAAMVSLAAWAQPCAAQPTTVSYQARLLKNDVPFSGTADLSFAIIDAGQTLWSNDGTSSGGSQPASSVAVFVVDGIFSLPLGGPPMDPLEAGLVNQSGQPALRVWVNTGGGFEQLAPDQKISSSIFSLASESANGAPGLFHALGPLKSGNSVTIDGTAEPPLANTVTVGGDEGIQLKAGTDITMVGTPGISDIEVGIGTAAPKRSLHIRRKTRGISPDDPPPDYLPPPTIRLQDDHVIGFQDVITYTWDIRAGHDVNSGQSVATGDLGFVYVPNSLDQSEDLT